ncbi:hypothetical protein BRC83_06460 [Halobacteriales archaeon QS_1_68_17]|nr:MAG: hypothetical protein BRC83_06460 [Halobacteriales archaeon QS_1_68_17]
MNVATELDAVARDHPSSLAVADDRRELTYADLRAETDAVAGVLAEIGVEEGERVALYMPGSVTFVTAYLGTVKRGAVPVALNLRFDIYETESLLEPLEPTALVTVERLESAADVLDVETLEHLLVDGGERGRSYHDLVSKADPREVPAPRLDDYLAEVVFTRGTTDEPRGVLHTHGNLRANAHALVHYWGLSSDDGALAACPPFHVLGTHGMVLPVLTAGGTVYFPSGWDESVLGLLEAREVTVTLLVPGMLEDLLDHGVDGYDLAALRRTVVAGGPLESGLRDRAERALECRVTAAYGTTETMPATALELATDRDQKPDLEPSFVGHPANEVVEVRVLDLVIGEAAPADRRGELLWRGDAVSPGYWGHPEANDELFVELDGEFWLRSGDLGRVDDEGRVFVDGRTSDAVVTDEAVFLASDIEDALYELDAIREAAVLTRSENPAVLVDCGGTDLSETTIRERCLDATDDTWAPGEVTFAASFPRSAIRRMNSRTRGGDWFDRTDSDGPRLDT